MTVKGGDLPFQGASSTAPNGRSGCSSSDLGEGEGEGESEGESEGEDRLVGEAASESEESVERYSIPFVARHTGLRLQD